MRSEVAIIYILYYQANNILSCSKDHRKVNWNATSQRYNKGVPLSYSGVGANLGVWIIRLSFLGWKAPQQFGILDFVIWLKDGSLFPRPFGLLTCLEPNSLKVSIVSNMSVFSMFK